MGLSNRPPPANAPKPGEIFAEKYRIERVIGMGGMGFVVSATHLHLDDKVAIKMLLPELASHEDTVARFLREGRAAVKIRSEHVGRVLDVGTVHGTPYIVMEFLDGCDLQQLLRDKGKLPYTKAVDYVLQACEAIAEAHAMKTVHRDLKPSNLYLTRRPNGTECVKVLDFGISKMDTPEGALAMTKTSAMMGSPLYMSPEQLRSAKVVDARADMWAIGVILYELIAGTPPFLAETLPELGALVLSGNAPWLSEAESSVPPGLSAVVGTCLRKRIEERFTTLADFADAIARFGGPGARGSADRIIGTLGFPQKRADVSLAAAGGGAPLSSPNLAPLGPASLGADARSQAVPVTPGAPTPASWGTGSQPSTVPNASVPTGAKPKKAAIVGIVVGGLVASGAMVGGLGYFALPRLFRHDVTASPASASAPVVQSDTALAPPPAVTPPASAPTPAPDPSPVAASSPAAAAPSPTPAAAAPTARSRPRPAAPTKAPTPTVAPAASAKPPQKQDGLAPSRTE